ncbi:MAG: 4Fe-4S cluster-binding domain-containing protein, partial [Eubacteriales bacterium]
MKTIIEKPLLAVSGIDRLRMGIDGNGIRTLVVTAGCPLRCRYCLNPHTWNGRAFLDSFSAEELYDRVKIDNLYFLTTGGGI